MFLNSLMVKAIQQKAEVDQQLKETRREAVLLRDKIHESIKIADEKVYEEIHKDPLFQKVSGISSDLRKIMDSIQSVYSHWSYIYNGYYEGWDCDFYDKDLAEILKPMEELIEKSSVHSRNLENKIMDPIRKKHYADVNALMKRLVKLEDEEKRLQQLSKDCYNLMYATLKPVLDVYLPLINEGFAAVGQEDIRSRPIITAKNIGEEGWQLELEYEEPFKYSDEIDEDDLDEEGLGIKEGLNSCITSFNKAFSVYCEKSIPGIDKIIVDYDDVELNGKTYHHKVHYEYDTGDDEPAEDCYYYYGKVTASTNVHVFVTIK